MGANTPQASGTGQLLTGGMLTGALPHSAALNDKLTISWGVDGDYLTMELAFTGGNAWFAVGFNAGGPMMPGTDAIMVQPGVAAGDMVQHVTVAGRRLADVATVPASTVSTAGVGPVFIGAGLPITAGVVGGKPALVARVARALTAAGAYSGAVDVSSGAPATVVYAHGVDGDTTMAPHALSDAGAASVGLGSGAVTALAPLVPPIKMSHATLMGIAWGVLAPLAVVIARYAKTVPPSTGPAAWWFTRHWQMQVAVVLMSCAGLVLGFLMAPPGTHLTAFHHVAGTVVVAAAVLQPLLGNKCVRPPKTPRSLQRLAWEAMHKTLGYGALALGVPVVFTGLQRLGAPWYYTAGYAAGVAVLAGAWISLEIQARVAAANKAAGTDATSGPRKSVAAAGASAGAGGAAPSARVISLPYAVSGTYGHMAGTIPAGPGAEASTGEAAGGAGTDSQGQPRDRASVPPPGLASPLLLPVPPPVRRSHVYPAAPAPAPGGGTDPSD
jgi:hypothetical protein